MRNDSKKFQGLSPLLYGRLWIKAAIQVLQQRMLMIWMFHFNSTPYQSNQLLGKGE
jgi:hypothetical protein